MTTPGGMQASEKCTISQEGSKQLLPGIPDDITLHHVVPKLPWEVFHILSSVSTAWLHGIRTRKVYHARLRSHSTKTLVVLTSSSMEVDYRAAFNLRRVYTVGLCSLGGTPKISECQDLQIYTGDLCSLEERLMISEHEDLQIHLDYTELPAIPYHGGEWVCSDGYIFLLGGVENPYPRDCTNKVFVFDVAGQRQWKECASMNELRTEFGCGVMHGKLYVFGGVSTLNHSFCGSEVYDPNEDSWSPIRPMTTLRYYHKVEAVGDELFVHGGRFVDRDEYNSRNARKMNDEEDDKDDADEDGTDFLEVYHPLKDEWRVVNPFVRDSEDYLFASRGNLYSMDLAGIYVYAGENSWTHLHSFSFPTTPTRFRMSKPHAAIVVGGELFVQTYCLDTGFAYFQSKGFGGESKEIVWQVVCRVGTHVANESLWQSSNRIIQL